MKKQEQWIYEMKCKRCGELSRYIARSSNVNEILSDQDISFVMGRKKLETPEWRYCEECEKDTAQEYISYYSEPEK